MGLFRPTYTKDGKKGRSKHWWLEYHQGSRRFRVNLRVRDKRAAEIAARDLLKSVERRAAGVADPFEAHARRPLTDHVVDFETALRARDVTKGHADDRMRYLKAFLAASSPERLADLDGSKAGAWLSTLRAQGLSARSLDIRRAALAQFGRWLVKEHRHAFNPFDGLSAANEDADRRHVRRGLDLPELVRLQEAAQNRPLEAAHAQRVNAGVTPTEEKRLRALGETRALLYAFAAGTGLRRKELKKLRWCDLDFDRAIVNVPAASAKARRDQWTVLRSDLARALTTRRQSAPATDHVFPAEAFPTLRTFKLDLVAAGIARRILLPDGTERVDTRDEQGRVVDFHSLRVSLGSNLARAGVHPANAKALLRHSKVELTMKHYTDVRLVDLKQDAEKLGVFLGAAPVTSTHESALTRTQNSRGKKASGSAAAPANPAGAALSTEWVIKDSNLRPPACQAGTLAS